MTVRELIQKLEDLPENTKNYQVYMESLYEGAFQIDVSNTNCI